MAERQSHRLDPLDDPDHLVSFPRVEGFLTDMFAALAPERQSELSDERDLVLGFLQMFPAGFIAQVPYPQCQTGEHVFQIIQPPPRWP